MRPSSQSRRKRFPGHQRHRFYPRMDVLENRLTPTTYTVNSAADTDDGVADAANTTLREAINAANANAGPDVIEFSIPSSGVKTINVGSTGLADLPPILEAVIINGYSQPGATANTLANGSNAVLLIELNGEQVVGSTAALNIRAVDVVIRGLVINRFFGGASPASGILVLQDSGADIMGNFIGSNAAGTAALPNFMIGIQVAAESLGARENEIGYFGTADFNVISGNSEAAIILRNNNNVSYNLIGTNAAGDAAVPNGGAGVLVLGSDNVLNHNVISGNGTGPGATHPHGVVLTQDAALSGGAYDPSIGRNDLQFNLIGTDASGTSALGNLSDGVFVEQSVQNTSYSNTIAHNGRNGVTIAGDERTTANDFAGNDFFQNANLGIDLGGDGPTVNDDGDADIGPNGLQNHPEIASVTLVRGTLTIRYRVTSAPANSGYPLHVQFYRADAKGQGQLRLGGPEFYEIDDAGELRTVVLDPSPGEFALGNSITATAEPLVGLSGGNSEFAPPVQSTNKEIVVSPVSIAMTNEAGGAVTFTVVLTAKPETNVSLNVRSSDSTEAIVSPAVLTFTRINFDKPQTVTVTGVDDAETDPDMPFEIQFDPAVSEDLAYNTLKLSAIELKNLDDEAGTLRVFVRLPSVTPNARFEYDVLVVNMGAKGTFNVWSELVTTPPNLVVLERVVSPRHARRRGRREYVAPVSIDVDHGESKAVVFRAQALPGSGGATLTGRASASTAGGPYAYIEASNTINLDSVTLSLIAPEEVFVPGITSFLLGGGTHFRYTISIHNPNAVSTAPVSVYVANGLPHVLPTITAVTIARSGTTTAIAASTRELNLESLLPGETVVIQLTVHVAGPSEEHSDVGKTYGISVGLHHTGIKDPLLTRDATTKVKAAIEYFFLAGLAALAGQEYLDQRRRRRKKKDEQEIDQDAADDVFAELAVA